MTVSIRQATIQDLLDVQHCNLLCLPENYKQKYFLYHANTWPHVSYVAVDGNKIIGYVLAKLDEEVLHMTQGHITSLAVQRPYRRRGIACSLMKQCFQSFIQVYNAHGVSLHVRTSNRAAFNLYTKCLGFTHVDTEESYYADGEDGLYLCLDLQQYAQEHDLTPADPDSFNDKEVIFHKPTS